MNFKELFKNKGIGYWICTGAAVLSLVMAIIVFATSGTALPRLHTDGYVIGIVPHIVVLPAPCKPHIIMTVGGLGSVGFPPRPLPVAEEAVSF